MEINRLTEMKEGYPIDLFNKLYKETKNLRKSLAYQIDHRRYGVSRDIIESWFDDKFMFVFNKYFTEQEPDHLKGSIINSLKFFKNRILRKAYNAEGEFYGSRITVDGEYDLLNIIPDLAEEKSENLFYDMAMQFMRSQLTDNAYILFQVQIDPPPFIMSRIQNCNSRISNQIIAEFLDLEYSVETESYIKSLKKEINNATKNAKDFFLKEDTLAFI
jgi:hypothetical protein